MRLGHTLRDEGWGSATSMGVRVHPFARLPRRVEGVVAGGHGEEGTRKDALCLFMNVGGGSDGSWACGRL
jgi:hypothetical protein